MMETNKQGRLMVITGASSGLGEACALYFAKQGWIVCALARNKEKLKRLAEKENTIFSYPTDVSIAKQVKESFAAIECEHGVIDVLINNAGYFGKGELIGESDIDAIDSVIDTNLKGAMYCVYAATPSMIERRNGQIINISSIGGIPGISVACPYGEEQHLFAGPPEGKVAMAPYGISKHGMTAMEDSLGRQLMKFDIRMTTLCPGGIETPLWEGDDGVNNYPTPGVKLMEPMELVNLIEFILKQPRHTLYKQITLFPTCEWK